MAVVPLSMMAVVAARSTARPDTLAPSSVTVQYLHSPRSSATFSSHAMLLTQYLRGLKALCLDSGGHRYNIQLMQSIRSLRRRESARTILF